MNECGRCHKDSAGDGFRVEITIPAGRGDTAAARLLGLGAAPERLVSLWLCGGCAATLIEWVANPTEAAEL